MPRYYVNNEITYSGDNIVHVEGCEHMPPKGKCTCLGDYSNCFDAVREAGKLFPRPNGCPHCARLSHVDAD